MIGILFALALTLQILGVLMLRNLKSRVSVSNLTKPVITTPYYYGVAMIAFAWLSVNGGSLVNAAISIVVVLILLAIWFNQNKFPLAQNGEAVDLLPPSQRTTLKYQKWILKSPFVILMIVSAIQIYESTN